MATNFTERVGTSKNDILRGTTGNDRLYGLGGNDILVASAGNDTLYGGDGFDLADFSGARAPVRVTLATPGDMQNLGLGWFVALLEIEGLIGSAYGDTLIGSLADNQIFGGAGNDYEFGDFGNDSLYGEAGDDTLDGGTGNDFLDGGIGNDSVVGGAGNDTLFGGEGNDTLRGGAGFDRIDGGPGIDLVSFQDATDSIRVDLGRTDGSGNSGGAGGDVIVNVEQVLGSWYHDYIKAAPTGQATLMGYFGSDTLIGGNDNDLLIGDDGSVGMAASGGGANDYLYGGPGNDTLMGGQGADYLDGGEGTDWVSYADSPRSIVLQLWRPAGQTSFNGTAAGDRYVSIEGIRGSNYGDSIVGGTASLLIDGGPGIDTITGGSGNDTIIGGPGADLLGGGGGFDTLTYEFSTGPVTYDYRDQLGTSNRGDAQDDATSGFEVVVLTSFGDVYVGGLVPLVVHGGPGNDMLTAGSARDTLFGDLGQDTLIGSASPDTFAFASVTDSLPNAPDIIRAFGLGDRIDLSAIDANLYRAGDQAFRLLASGRFTGTAGELILTKSGGNTFVSLDIDGDRVADCVIMIVGTPNLDGGLTL